MCGKARGFFFIVLPTVQICLGDLDSNTAKEERFSCFETLLEVSSFLSVLSATNITCNVEGRSVNEYVALVQS
jgi:hypothetical protein